MSAEWYELIVEGRVYHPLSRRHLLVRATRRWPGRLPLGIGGDRALADAVQWARDHWQELEWVWAYAPRRGRVALLGVCPSLVRCYQVKCSPMEDG